MADTQFDIIVIGGGPGGYVAAIRAAQLGMKAAVVEREHLGGICLNWGCIPTKALLRRPRSTHLLHHLDDYGLSAKEVASTWRRWSSGRAASPPSLIGGVKHLLKKNKVTVIDGHGHLARQGQDQGREGRHDARSANSRRSTSSSPPVRAPVTFPNMEADGKLVWTYRHAMVPETMPKSLLVIGSGAIGIEFASFYRNMGAKVTVVEMLDRILPAEDEEISRHGPQVVREAGHEDPHRRQGDELQKGADNVTTTIEANGKTETITVDRVILAVGIVGNVEHIGLENTEMKTEKYPHRHRRVAGAPASPASTPSATWSAPPGWPTRRATKASSASSTSPASRKLTRSTSTTSRAAPIRTRRLPASV